MPVSDEGSERDAALIDAAETAASYSYRSDRDLVVYTAVSAYLLVISDEATVETTHAQLKTAETLHVRTVDQNKASSQ